MSRVTVCLPVRDGLPHLGEAVASILGQSIQDLRVLIADDGSTDGSAEYLDGLDDPRVQVLHEPPMGTGAALNRCLEVVETPYLARMDADDVAAPDRLERQLEFLEQHPEVVLCGSRFEYFTGNGVRRLAPPMPLSHEEITSAVRSGFHGVCHGTVVVRTAAMRDAGGYRVKGPGQFDDLLLRLAESGKLVNLEDVLLAKRVHAENTTRQHAEEVWLLSRYGRVADRCRRHGRDEPTPEEFFERHRREGGRVKRQARRGARSQRLYQRGLVAYLSGKTLAPLALWAMAGSLDPRRLVRRLTRLLGPVTLGLGGPDPSHLSRP